MLPKFDFRSIFERMVDDTYRYYVQLLFLAGLMGVTSLGMSLLNAYTGKQTLMLVTFLFACVSLGVCYWVYHMRRTSLFSYSVFISAVLSLFFYFLISGAAEGFSPIWICVLPTCGMLFFGLKVGFIVCSVMWVGMVFLFWTAPGQGLLLYPYTTEFLMRFPILYVAFGAVGYTFEKIRAMTHDELKRLRKQFEMLAITDPLTQIRNRHWFDQSIRSLMSETLQTPNAMILLDIDHFKNVNDQYGHVIGDHVLVEVAAAIEKTLEPGDLFCRWGGEEFLLFAANRSRQQAEHYAQTLRKTLEGLPLVSLKGDVFSITVSIGVAFVDTETTCTATDLFRCVDDLLYQAKEEGRNRVIVGEMSSFLKA